MSYVWAAVAAAGAVCLILVALSVAASRQYGVLLRIAAWVCIVLVAWFLWRLITTVIPT